MNRCKASRSILGSSLAVTGFCAALLGASGVASADDAYFIHDVRVFDGTNVIESTNVVTNGDHIVGIGSNLTAPPGATVIDGTGQTLMPGLIDAHAHVFWLNQLNEALLYGETTAIGMWDSPDLLAYQQCAGPATDRADLIGAGLIGTVAEGHGSGFGFPYVDLSSASDAHDFVDGRVAEGAHHVKLVLEDYSLFAPTTVPELPIGIHDAVVRAAHNRNLLAVTHVTTLSDALNAIQGGADGLAHVPIDQVATSQFAHLANQRDAFITATLVVLHAGDGASIVTSPLEDPLLSPWLTSTAAAFVGAPPAPGFGDRWSFQTALDSINYLNGQHVPILAGTDAFNAGTAHGASMHKEMELLVYAGLTPIEALRAATSRPAQYFRLDDRGRIQVGKLADMVLVNGDPTTDIQATKDIAAIWRRGVLIDRTSVFDIADQPPIFQPTCP